MLIHLFTKQINVSGTLSGRFHSTRQEHLAMRSLGNHRKKAADFRSKFITSCICSFLFTPTNSIVVQRFLGSHQHSHSDLIIVLPGFISAPSRLLPD
jgi:hypothetical protein